MRDFYTNDPPHGVVYFDCLSYRFIGVAVMDIDFLKIDFNACPVSIGNPGPSFLSGVSKCKTRTTQVSLARQRQVNHSSRCIRDFVDSTIHQ